MLAGMDVVRFNFSHWNHEEQSKRIALMRRLNRRYRRQIKLLGDLEGYRIRIGRLKEPLEIKRGQTVWLTKEDVEGQNRVIPFDYPGSLKDIRLGQFIYIDDGSIALVVKGRNKRYLQARVVIGGIVKGHKGVNLPGAKLDFGGFTQKDRRDLGFCIKNRFDYIAQSFVRGPRDILEIRELLGDLPGCQVIAKIENREALRNIGEIIEVSDGLMIARGDLGVSIPIYEVPIIQKQIIKRCNQRHKFVITATQMLESMTVNPVPTRAEVSDVANAVLDGSDFLMLSAETAVGQHPIETTGMMNRIIEFIEGYLSGRVKEVYGPVQIREKS